MQPKDAENLCLNETFVIMPENNINFAAIFTAASDHQSN